MTTRDRMHRFTDETAAAATEIETYANERIRLDPPPLDHPRTPAELARRVGRTVTPEGLGPQEALRVYARELAPATISTDHPLFLAFVPAAPTKLSVLFDLVVSASSIVGTTWMEAAGCVYAENQALRWLADLAGLPETAGGCFVSGGSAGNLSGLVAARQSAASRLEAEGRERPVRWRVAAVDEAHSSIRSAARIMDADVLPVRHDERGRLTSTNLEAALTAAGPDELDSLFAVVATAGTTNVGIVDDLAGVARICRDRGLWFHVDAAYGGGALCAPSARSLFDGIEHADSLVIDPHKWLFAPYDCAALLYRDPRLAAAAHTQEASYLDEVNVAGGWSPDPLRVPPHAAPAGAAVLVLARLARDRRVPRCGRRRPGADARGGRRHPSAAVTRATAGTRALGRDLPPPRMGARGLRRLVRSDARRTDRVLPAQRMERRAGDAFLLRQPAHDVRRCRRPA